MDHQTFTFDLRIIEADAIIFFNGQKSSDLVSGGLKLYGSEAHHQSVGVLKQTQKTHNATEGKRKGKKHIFASTISMFFL